MSFRTRLTLFFVLIVVVPLVAVAFVLFHLVSDSETGKADARVSEGRSVATGLYNQAVRDAGPAARAVGRDRLLALALRAGDDTRARARAKVVLARTGARRIMVVDGSRIVLDVGSRDAVAPALHDLVGVSGTQLGRLEVSVHGAGDLAGLVGRVSGLDVAVARGGQSLAATLPAARPRALPAGREMRLAGTRYRASAFSAPDFANRSVRITVLDDAEGLATVVLHDRLLIGGVLLAFLAVACLFALAVSRSLQAQIARLLAAARRIGRGDFATTIAIDGDDELAQLGGEFNRMAGELAARVEELSRQRRRLGEAIRRTGDAAAFSLDREVLLEVMLRSTVEGAEATCGRVSVPVEGSSELDERVRMGELADHETTIERAEHGARNAGILAEASDGARHALAFPLRASDGSGDVLGIVAVSRVALPFSDGERELFVSLAEQAALALGNVSLHERARRQAVTDALTGLANRRRFQEVLAAEVARAHRDEDLAVMLLDVDDFKEINDVHGHQQGDAVLRQIADVLRESCREIDEPARNGGDELAVVLPGADLAGAEQLAERVRASIGALTIPLVRGEGDPLRVSASLGVAAVRGQAATADGLMATADAALYAAKRAGKNATAAAR